MDKGEGMIKKERYYYVDVMRMVCALLVVMMHTAPLEGINENINFFLLQIVGRIAVPFFFICTGYFLYNKLESDNVKQKISNTLCKLCNLYLIWSGIYLIYYIYGSISIGRGFIKSVILYIRNFLFIGSHFHLWYLVATLLGIYIIYKVYNKIEFKYLLALATILYLIGLLGNGYSNLLQESRVEKALEIYTFLFQTTRNGLFFAFPYITIGVALNKYNIKDRIKNNYILLIIAFMGLTLEGFILKKYIGLERSDMYIMLVPVSILIFSNLLKININRIESFIANKATEFRELSLVIYCVHGVFLIILPYIYKVIGWDKLVCINLINFIVVFVCSWGVGKVLIKSKILHNIFIEPNYIKINM